VTTEVERLSSATVVRVVGRLEAQAIAALRHSVIEELTGSSQLLVLDLSAVDHTNQDAIAVLVSAAEMAGEADIGIGLVVSPDGPVQAALADADKIELFEIFSSIGQALDQFG
jgi:anti-anti-sigma regulatory factor